MHKILVYSATKHFTTFAGGSDPFAHACGHHGAD